MRSSRWLYWACAALVMAALLTVSSPWAGADGRRTEEIAMAWVEAFNSGEVEKMAAFRAAHREGGRDGWEQQFESLVEKIGRIEPTDVMIEGDAELVIVADSTGAGGLRLVFRFSEQDPERVSSIAIDRSGGGRPNDLPPLALGGGDWSARSAAIDEYLEGLAAADLFSGAVLIAEGGKVRFEGAYGLASREFSVANTLDTRFDIGSITKDFTRVAIAQLIATGKLGPDDTVGEHLPDYPNPRVRNEVTIGQLFEHRSGLGDYFTAEWGQTPMGALRDHRDYIDIWGPKPLEFEPGSRSQYSNFGFTVLGAIIDRVSGQPYFEYVAEQVFEPAGMTASGFFATDDIVPEVAVGYTRMIRGGERGETLRKNIYLEPAVGGPWGKTYSTARDLWRFWRALSEHRLTPPAYTAWVLLSGPVPTEGSEPSEVPPIADMGLGGGGPGLSAELLVSGDRVFVTLANLDPPITFQVTERLEEGLEGASTDR